MSEDLVDQRSSFEEYNTPTPQKYEPNLEASKYGEYLPSFNSEEEKEHDNNLVSQDLGIKNSQEEGDSPIFLHVENVGRKYGEPTPFFITLQVNEVILHNCVLDLAASTNIMP
jgi:hypothetical protein